MKKYLVIAVVAIVSLLAGRFLSPKEVEIKQVEKIVYKESVTKDKDQSVIEKETRLPDGTVIKEKRKDTSTHIEKNKEIVTEKEYSKTVQNRPSWMLTGLYEPAVKGFQEVHYSIGVQRRVLGEIYLGASVSSKRTIGLVLSFAF